MTGTLKATLQEKKILSIHVSILFTWECHKAFCVGERSRESIIEKRGEVVMLTWILPTVQKHRPARKAPRRKEDLP